MKRATVEAIIVIVAGLGILCLLTEPQWRPALHAKLAPTVEVQPIKFADAMRCPQWKPGLSRTLTVLATEDEQGTLTQVQCVRLQERGKFRVM